MDFFPITYLHIYWRRTWKRFFLYPRLILQISRQQLNTSCLKFWFHEWQNSPVRYSIFLLEISTEWWIQLLNSPEICVFSHLWVVSYLSIDKQAPSPIFKNSIYISFYFHCFAFINSNRREPKYFKCNKIVVTCSSLTLDHFLVSKLRLRGLFFI